MSSTEWIYLTFLALSFVFILCYSGYTIFSYRNISPTKRAFSTIVFYVAGVFIATVLVFIPIYYVSYCFGDRYTFVRPLFLSLHNALRVFILDGEFDIVKKAVKGLCEPLHVAYSLYCAVLYVIAPVLTLGTVLSFFKNFVSEIRYRFCGKKTIYIFSKLNDGSMTLAKSIRNKYPDKKAVFVFTDVYEQDNEISHEFALEASHIHAICLKRDVTQLDILSKKGDVEIFLIDENEAENVSQASLLTEQFNRVNKKQNIKIFVFAKGRENGYIIDSLNYGNLLDRALYAEFASHTFKIRRVNSVKQLVWRTIPKAGLFERCENKTISAMIAGIGSFGTEFFKMLVWYCQTEGYSLELNVFDKGRKTDSGEKYSIESVLARQCPELFQMNPCNRDGEARYDIKCYDGIDFSNDSFEKLWEDEATRKRLMRTSFVLVSLGNDDVNIETAVYLRSLFDRKKGIVATNRITDDEERPSIYAIVYDGVRSGVVSSGGDEFLKNHKAIPYHIHFIGSIEQQYDYDNVYDFDLEQEARRYHVEWLNVSYEEVKDARKKHYDPALLPNMDTEKVTELIAADSSYEQYEYYRLSSLAKALHKKMLKDHQWPMTTKIEHIRWNAYMRTEGYGDSKGAPRADRALLHDELVDWKSYHDDKRKDR